MTYRVVIAAGGTGGHIFPGIALAQALKQKGWVVHWMGSSGGMEEALVKREWIPFHGVPFRGLRGKGVGHAIRGTFSLLKSGAQALYSMRKIKPNLVVGFGGYPSVPGVWAAHVLGIPIIVHESNRLMGLANRMVAGWAAEIATSFPDTQVGSKVGARFRLKRKITCTGAPLRKAFEECDVPQSRYQGRQGPLRLVVVGGSQGALTLNTMVPEALSRIPLERRPIVVHQSGEKHIVALKQLYARYQVDAECVSFVEDMPYLYSEADVVICRAGALTIAELLAVGVPGLYIPLPFATDQPVNARWCEENKVGWCMPQASLTAEILAERILGWTREDLAAYAELAYKRGVRNGTERLVELCERVVA